MPTTLRNTDILFNDGTTQSTAATADSRDFGGVGSYAVLMNAGNADLGVGATVAGSSLRYNNFITVNNILSSGAGANPFGGYVQVSGGNYNAGGTAVSGTWRKMSGGPVFVFDSGYNIRFYSNALYVRIS